MSAGVKRARRSAAAAALVVVWSVGLPARPARAHPEPPSTLINRYATLWVSGSRLDVQFSLLHGPLTAPETRRQMDGDGDGRLSEAELVRHGRALAAEARDHITVELDGRPLALAWVPRIDLNGNPAVANAPLVRELGGRAALPAGEHRLVVRLGPPFPRLGDTEIALEAGDGWTLVASEPPAGVSAGGRRDRFQLLHGHDDGQAAPRAAFVVRSGTGGRQAGGGPVLPLALAIAGAGVAAAIWFARRGRQRP